MATTPVHPDVLAEMSPHFTSSFGNPHSSDHALGWEASEAVELAATRVGKLIGADPDEIVFTSGATESNNLALLGVGRRASAGGRRRILLSETEHKCVLACGRVLEGQLGFDVEHVPVDSNGFVSQQAFEELLSDDVLLVSVMVVNNEIGTIQDIKTLAGIARSAGAIFHCDAAQAPVAIDLRSIAERVDLLSLSSHKMYGPKGVGALYISRNLQENIEPLIYGGEQQRGIRSGTLPVPLCVGMGAAAKMFSEPDILERRRQLRLKKDRLVDGLRRLGHSIGINGPGGEFSHPGSVNVAFNGLIAQDILGALQPRVAASTGAACTSGIAEPSHVLRAIGLSSDVAESSIRFSPGFSTHDKDIDETIELIADVLERLSA